MFAYVIIVSAACFVLAVAGALRIRNRRRPDTTGRTGECSVCGATGITGPDWWTLTTFPSPIPGESTFGGGTVMQQDYCAAHKPRQPELRHHG